MKTRKWIFRLHLYAGLSVGLLLALIGVTGSFLVFGDEIDGRLNRQLLRSTPQGQAASAQAVLERVAGEYPQETIARVRLPRESGDVYEVCFKARENARCVYVDSRTTEILGARVPNDSFTETVFRLHRRLLSGETGETIVGIAGILLLVMSISGAVLWLPGDVRNLNVRNLKRSFRVKLGGNWKRNIYDLHKLIGIVALAFLCVSASTGAYMVFRTPLDAAVNSLTRSAPRPKPPTVQAREATQTVTLDALLQTAHAALPLAELMSVNLPTTANAAVAVRAKMPEEIHPNGRSTVYLNQASGAVLRVDDAAQAPLGTRIANSIYPIHVGRAGGIVTRVLQVFVGLTPALLFVSGLLMWRNRIVAARRRQAIAAGKQTAQVTTAVGL